MLSECTIFLDIDGVLSYCVNEPNIAGYRLDVEFTYYTYNYDKSAALINNVYMLCQLLQPNLVCCSTWRLGRSVDKINGMMDQVFGVQAKSVRFTDKLRDRRFGEHWGAREEIIWRHVAEHQNTCKYWLVVDDLPLMTIPWTHHVMPEAGEGFSLDRLAEAFDKIAKQGGY